MKLINQLTVGCSLLALIACTKSQEIKLTGTDTSSKNNLASANLIAFPGAEGYGKTASGGRGGQVVEVTNLNDSGSGSFRDAFSKYPNEPITIVFRVAGIIELASPIKVNRSNVTIAGQTAPGDGVCLKGNSFILNGGGRNGNIIIRYLRSRPGGNSPSGIYGFDMENMSKVIIDHCSFTWANEECAAMYDIKNITVQWSIVSEGLYNAGHLKGSRSYAGVWGGQYASYHHNLITNQYSRTVRFNGSRAHDTVARVDYRNNVIYNWGKSNACYGGGIEIPNGRSEINMVGNYYKPGPATAGLKQVFCEPEYLTSTGKWFLSGNFMVGNSSLNGDNYLGLDLNRVPEDKRSAVKATGAFSVVAINTQSAADAYIAVLAGAGALLPRRDAVDSRLVNETRNNNPTGMGSFNKLGIIDNPLVVGGWPTYATTTVPVDTDHDGMPDAWEKANGLNKADPTDRNKIHSSGYTMLEVYLNSIQ